MASTNIEHESIPIWLAKGTMKLPLTPVPVIMVGPGTGIAAFRSFIQHITRVNPLQKLVLIFGCRCESKDFYYANEWQ